MNGYGRNNREAWAAFSAHLGMHGEAVTAAMQELYTLYTRDMLTWSANLYDDAVGGFYYANSARDTEGYLPDIESTYDFFALLFFTGAIRGCGDVFEDAIGAAMPQWLQKKVTDFLLPLQAEDGYFYHPQWEKEKHTVSRLGRDLGSAKRLLRAFGSAPRYELSSPVSEETKQNVPERYHSEAAFRRYLDSLQITRQSYHAISQVLTQIPQIRTYSVPLGADLMAITMEWLIGNIRADNGLWQPEVNYYSVNGLHKATRIFNAEKTVIPHAEKGIRNTMSVILSEEVPAGVVDVYNPWHVLSDTLKNLRTCGSDAQRAEASRLLAEIRAMAPAGIRKSRDKLSAYRHADGSFSYCRGHSSSSNQGMPSAVPDRAEGDANGNGCAVIGLVPSVFGALDAEAFFVPIFDEDDLAYTVSVLEKRRLP